MTPKKPRPSEITILGAGPAGLTAAYYARKSGLPFTIYERSGRVGGNSVTLRHGPFAFDSGAHLLQTKDAEVINEVSNVLGEKLDRITLPLQTYYNGIVLDFPFSPLNLLQNMGLGTLAKSTFEILSQRPRNAEPEESFESYATRSYGRTIAQNLLLNYTEKLWGTSCLELSRKVGGAQLRGLNFKTFLEEAVCGRTAWIERLAGQRYYPKNGFGTIMERLAEACGPGNIHTNSSITRISHDHRRIHTIEINGQERTRTDEVLSTMPLDVLLQLIDPPPPPEISALAGSLRFRYVVLVTLFLNKESVTQGASVHFPERRFHFTRIHEPKNRSKCMAPPEQTSLVAEIPCYHGDELWEMEDEKLISLVSSALTKIRWINREEVVDGLVTRLRHAYPVLQIDHEQKVQAISRYLGQFSNLTLLGRSGTFLYVSFHQIMRSSKSIIDVHLR